MGLLADLILAVANWVEAEAGALRHGALRFALGGVLIASGLAVLLFGSALLLWALFTLLAGAATPAWSRILVGIIFAAAAIGLLLTARRAAR